MTSTPHRRVSDTNTNQKKGANVVHLVCYVLKPAMCGLDARDHLSQLCADDGLSVQWLAERLPLLRPPARREKSLVSITGARDTGQAGNVLEALLHDQTLSTQAHGEDHPPLVVEVTEDNRHASALLTERVGQWNADLVERHECCACSGRIRSLDRLGRKLIRARNKDDGVSTLRLATNGEVIRERAIRYPSVGLRINNGRGLTPPYSKNETYFFVPEMTHSLRSL
jgi:hypothetical protein